MMCICDSGAGEQREGDSGKESGVGDLPPRYEESWMYENEER